MTSLAPWITEGSVNNISETYTVKGLFMQRFFTLLFMPFLACCYTIETQKDAILPKSTLGPEDILPDQNDYATFSKGSINVRARKGTIAASIKNAARLNDPACTHDEKVKILIWFKENALALAIIFQGELMFSNTLLQQILNEANETIAEQ